MAERGARGRDRASRPPPKAAALGSRAGGGAVRIAPRRDALLSTVMAQQSTRKGSRAAPSKSKSKRKRSRRPRRSDSVGRNVAAVRDVVTKSVLAPLNAVLLTRKLIEEVVDDAVRRGRMTRDDAQQLLQALLQRGAKQTDDFLS